jgi:hypothetical protein
MDPSTLFHSSSFIRHSSSLHRRGAFADRRQFSAGWLFHTKEAVAIAGDVTEEGV